MKWKGASPPVRPGEGFTLIEALVVIALSGLLLGTLAAVTSRWLPGWKAGFARVQSTDLLGLGLDRIAADIGAAEYISPGGPDAAPLFVGESSSLTFVRAAIGPNSAAGLEIVRLAEIDDLRGRILVRSRADFVPSVTAESLDAGTVEFTNPVVLIRPPFRVSFAYAGQDRLWQETWLGAPQLPEAVRITVRGVETDDVLPASTAAVININAPASCVTQPGPACGTPQERGQPQQTPAGGNGGTNAGAGAPGSAQ